MRTQGRCAIEIKSTSILRPCVIFIVSFSLEIEVDKESYDNEDR